MSSVYNDVMKEVFGPVSDDMATGFKKKMAFIQGKWPHSKKTVESCLEGMSEKPTLVELMAAAYLVNGGLLFKHEERADSDGDDPDYAQLLKEMDELNCHRDNSAKSPPVTTSSTEVAHELDIFGESND